MLKPGKSGEYGTNAGDWRPTKEYNIINYLVRKKCSQAKNGYNLEILVIRTEKPRLRGRQFPKIGDTKMGDTYHIW